MGRGNYLPPRMEDYKMLYVSIPMSEDEYQTQMWLDFLEMDIKDALTNSFWFEDNKWLNRESKVIASNSLIDIVIANNEWSVAVVVGNTNLEYFPNQINLAARHIPLIYEKIKRKLKDCGYEFRARNGAWCSSIL